MNNNLLPLESGNIGKLIFHSGGKAKINAYPFKVMRLEEGEFGFDESKIICELYPDEACTLIGKSLIMVAREVLVSHKGFDLPSWLIHTRNRRNLILSPEKAHTIAGLRETPIDSSPLFLRHIDPQKQLIDSFEKICGINKTNGKHTTTDI